MVFIPKRNSLQSKVYMIRPSGGHTIILCGYLETGLEISFLSSATHGDLGMPASQNYADFLTNNMNLIDVALV